MTIKKTRASAARFKQGAMWRTTIDPMTGECESQIEYPLGATDAEKLRMAEDVAKREATYRHHDQEGHRNWCERIGEQKEQAERQLAAAHEFIRALLKKGRDDELPF